MKTGSNQETSNKFCKRGESIVADFIHEYIYIIFQWNELELSAFFKTFC